jgi:hypothetical protein
MAYRRGGRDALMRANSWLKVAFEKTCLKANVALRQQFKWSEMIDSTAFTLSIIRVVDS